MIDFSRIVEISRDEKLQTTIPASGTPPVMDAYDDTWGFVTVKQDIAFEYNESQYNYDSPVTVTLNGVFSINADTAKEIIPGNDDNFETTKTNDKANFDTVKKKYETLRDLLLAACRQTPPDALSDYGTESDLRCVKLPKILLDETGGFIYMRPFSISLAETHWSNTIAYTAVLKEVQKPACKISVSGYIINDAVIDIVMRRPRTSIEKFALANGGDIFFTGWEPRQYKLSGELSGIIPSGCFFTDASMGLANALISGTVDFKETIPDVILPSGVFRDLFISSLDFSANKSGTGTSISIEGRE